MKILVISLLRIGDIVLSAPVLRGLRERHPEAEIHLLINKQFAGIAPLVPYVDRFFHFDRAEMQKGLGEPSRPLFDSYELLASLVDELNGQNYDLAVNLTHSRLSGWLMSVIEAKQRTGLCFDNTGRAGFGSSWFRFLNTQVEAEGEEVFHFTDVFRFALGVGEEVHRPALIETLAGAVEATRAITEMCGESDGFIAVQALTSDAKKDWGLNRFEEALTQFAARYPSVPVAIVGAPFESERLMPLVNGLRDRGVKAHAAILSFEGAFSLIKRAKLLLTCDTSIKHLACAARTPVVEISLGSADYHRTGAYLHGSVIIQSREMCAPCQHSKSCHRESHACAVRIPASVVAMVTGEIFGGRVFQMKAIAEEYKNEVDILRVESRASGFWAAYSVLEPFTEDAIGRWVDLACRKIWLETSQGKDGREIEFGTETRRLAMLLRGIHTGVSDLEWRHLLGDFERQVMMLEGRLNSFKTGIRVLHGTYEDPRAIQNFVKHLIGFRDKIRPSALLGSFKGVLDQVIEDDISPPFTRFRRIVDAVSEIERRAQIDLRLIRGLVDEFSRPKEQVHT